MLPRFSSRSSAVDAIYGVTIYHGDCLGLRGSDPRTASWSRSVPVQRDGSLKEAGHRSRTLVRPSSPTTRGRSEIETFGPSSTAPTVTPSQPTTKNRKPPAEAAAAFVESL